jgi:hypothetical protein
LDPSRPVLPFLSADHATRPISDASYPPSPST